MVDFECETCLKWIHRHSMLNHPISSQYIQPINISLYIQPIYPANISSQWNCSLYPANEILIYIQPIKLNFFILVSGSNDILTINLFPCNQIPQIQPMRRQIVARCGHIDCVQISCHILLKCGDSVIIISLGHPSSWAVIRWWQIRLLQEAANFLGVNV